MIIGYCLRIKSPRAYICIPNEQKRIITLIKWTSNNTNLKKSIKRLTNICINTCSTKKKIVNRNALFSIFKISTNRLSVCKGTRRLRCSSNVMPVLASEALLPPTRTWYEQNKWRRLINIRMQSKCTSDKLNSYGKNNHNENIKSFSIDEIFIILEQESN